MFFGNITSHVCTSEVLSSLFSAAIMSERGKRAASNQRCPFCKVEVNFSGNRTRMLRLHINYHCVNEDGQNKPTKNLEKFEQLKKIIGSSGKTEALELISNLNRDDWPETPKQLNQGEFSILYVLYQKAAMCAKIMFRLTLKFTVSKVEADLYCCYNK